MKQNAKPKSGQFLLNDFQAAFVAAATLQVAKNEAERSENILMNQLTSMGGGTYLNPSAMDGALQTDVTRASLDAHIKKVQVAQMDAMSADQLQAMSIQDTNDYVGRKIRVTPKGRRKDVIESVWFNPQTGYRVSPMTRSQITGIITEVWLDKNVLVVKPAFLSRTINPELKQYLVYVVDPATLEPMIDLTLV